MYGRMVQEAAALDVQSLKSNVSPVSKISILSQIEICEEDAWTLIRKELLDGGISSAQILANKDDIIAYSKDVVQKTNTGLVEDPLREETQALQYYFKRPPSLQQPSWSYLLFDKEDSFLSPTTQKTVFTSPLARICREIPLLDAHGFHYTVAFSLVLYGQYMRSPACLFLCHLFVPKEFSASSKLEVVLSQIPTSIGFQDGSFTYLSPILTHPCNRHVTQSGLGALLSLETDSPIIKKFNRVKLSWGLKLSGISGTDYSPLTLGIMMYYRQRPFELRLDACGVEWTGRFTPPESSRDGYNLDRDMLKRIFDGRNVKTGWFVSV